MEHQYARCATEIHAARTMIYNAARLKCSGEPFIMEAAMAKLYASEVNTWARSDSTDIISSCGKFCWREFSPSSYFYL